MTPYSLVDIYRGTCCLHLLCTRVIYIASVTLYHEEESGKYLLNVGKHLPVYKVSHPKTVIFIVTTGSLKSHKTAVVLPGVSHCSD
jgi:hypothetical protein